MTLDFARHGRAIPLLTRLVRNLVLVCAAMALVAWAVAPARPLIAGGVLGGGALVLLAVWALAGAVTALTNVAEMGGNRRVSRALHFVKFFTRHAILALAGYVMMVRLHLDPIGMFVGVTSIVVAAALEAARSK